MHYNVNFKNQTFPITLLICNNITKADNVGSLFRIPDVFGENSSMNVVQATNIALYKITKTTYVNSFIYLQYEFKNHF